MEYSQLAAVYDRLAATTSRLEKTDIITDFLGEADPDLLKVLPHLLMGMVFPDWSPLELGIGPGNLYDCITFVTKVKRSELNEMIKEEGDVGSAAEILFSRKVQRTILSQPLTIDRVYETFIKIAEKTGRSSIDWKTKHLSNLLSDATPLEAKYLVRTVLGELRVGVAAGLVRDAIAKAYNTSPDVVERAYMLTNDFGKVAVNASREGEEGLNKLSMEVGVPIKPMLAQIAPSLAKVMGNIDEPAFEVKYDGARIQIHKNGDEIRIFSRRLEDVTAPLPDVVDRAREAITADRAIIEGEAVAVDLKTDRPAPFQAILRRFRRKYRVEEMVEKIPFDVFIFDILYIEDRTTIDEVFRDRRKILEEILVPQERFSLAGQLVTTSLEEAEGFYQEALAMGHEGAMIKNLEAPYIPGARVGYMYKIKPVMETLDLVIIAALWGKGKRKGWLSSYLLGAWDQDKGELVPVGRVATGVTEEQLEEYTRLLTPLVEFDQGGEAKIKPEVVVEVGYQEIQRSPNYESGYALRFPRIVRMRDDKSARDADDMERVAGLYGSQGSQG